MTKCEFCAKKLNAKEFGICQACKKLHSKWCVWKGMPTSFSSGPQIPSKIPKKQGEQSKLV